MLTGNKVINRRDAYLLILGSIFVAAFQLLAIYPCHLVIDPPNWDEGYYMSSGRSFWVDGAKLPNIGWAPLYSLLYSVITRFVDTFSSVYFMRYLITAVLAVLLFLFLYLFLRSYPIAILLTLTWSLSKSIVYADKCVYHFALILLILALISSRVSRILSISILLLCCLVRVEYLLVLFAYLCYILFLYLRFGEVNLRNRNKAVSMRSVVIVSSVMVIGLFIFTFKNMDGFFLQWRSRVAFMQHYAFRESMVGDTSINPWYGPDAYRIFCRDFPGCCSIFQAARKNPRAFLNHILFNVKRLRWVPWSVVEPVPIYVNRWLSLCYIFLAIFILSGYVLSFDIKRFIGNLKNEIVLCKDAIAMCAIASIGIVPSIVIMPERRLSLMLVPGICLYVGRIYRDRTSFV